jgi:hypothetical protein
LNKFLPKFRKPLLGAVLGAVAGYAYYYFVGCSSGTCAITSKPINSTLYGALMGGLLITSFKRKDNANRKFN